MKFKNFVKKKYFSKLFFFLAIFIFAIIIINPFEIFSYFPKLLLLISFLFAVSYLSIFINKQIDIYISIITMSVFFSIFITELYLAYKNYNYITINPSILDEKKNKN